MRFSRHQTVLCFTCLMYDILIKVCTAFVSRDFINSYFLLVNPKIPAEPKVFNTRNTRTRHFKFREFPYPTHCKLLLVSAGYLRFQFPPEPDFFHTRDTRTRVFKFREFPYPPEPDFFRTRPITTIYIQKNFT